MDSAKLQTASDSTATSPATKPLIIISSRTGNTLTVGHAICDGLPGCVMMRPSELPEDLSGYNPVLLGFWNDNHDAPQEMKAVAGRLRHKDIGCFATMGGNPETEAAREWMAKTSEALVNAGEDNRLVRTFLCQGRIDPAMFDQMTALLGGKLSDETLAKAHQKKSETHPDRLDLSKAVELFRGAFGSNW